MASRKNQLSDAFFKIGFMPYFLSSNSPLSRYLDRNYERALASLNHDMENAKTPFFPHFPGITNDVSPFF